MQRKGSITIRVTLLAIVMLSTACSKAVRMPPEDWKTGLKPDTYRIRLHGRVEYLVGWYTLTDSTVVIEELLPADQRYVQGREQLPIAIPRDQVASIAKQRINWATTIPVMAICAGLVGVFIWFLVDSPLN